MNPGLLNQGPADGPADGSKIASCAIMLTSVQHLCCPCQQLMTVPALLSDVPCDCVLDILGCTVLPC